MRNPVTLRRALLAAAAAPAFWSSPAWPAACAAASQGVNFGAFTPIWTAGVNGAGNVSVNCDFATPFVIKLSAGSGTYSSRTMVSGARKLAYNLYQDPQRRLVWGDGAGGTSTVSATAKSGTYWIYGFIPTQVTAYPGTYSDTIIVTIEY